MTRRLLKTFEDNNNLINALVPLTIDIDEVYFVYHHDVKASDINRCSKIINKYKNIKVYYKRVSEEEVTGFINEDTIIDVSAAKYLSIVLYEIALKNNLQVIYYDEEERVIKQYKNHKTISEAIFKLTIEDIVKLGGGKITSNLHKAVTKREDIELIYKAVDKAKDQYSHFTSFVSRINAYINDFPSSNNICHLNERVIKKITCDEQYQNYKDLGLFEIKENDLIFYNKDIKDAFTVSGTFLENYIYHKLLDSKLFDDVKMSNIIEFNDEQHKYPVNCEIDALVLKNNELLFVSIKSNKVEKTDLNEIKVHNIMFGNKQSKAVVCSNNDLSKQKPSVYAKAEELGLYVIDNTDFINQNLANKFNDIIEGTYVYERI